MWLSLHCALKISALPPYYLHSVCVSPLGKKSYRNTQHQVHYACNNVDSTIWLSLPSAVKHPSSHPHISKCQSFPLEATSICLQSLYCFTQTRKETSIIVFFFFLVFATSHNETNEIAEKRAALHYAGAVAVSLKNCPSTNVVPL